MGGWVGRKERGEPALELRGKPFFFLKRENQETKSESERVLKQARMARASEREQVWAGQERMTGRDTKQNEHSSPIHHLLLQSAKSLQ